jgi:hypothetical protein
MANRSCSRGGSGSSSEWEIKPSSLTGKKPRHSNNHGRQYEISGDECPQLAVRSMDVSLDNITRVSIYHRFFCCLVLGLILKL